jgi:hypothetical protein
MPPPACDWHRSIPLDGDALGNDDRSNCVPCGALRSIQIRRAVAAGDQRKPTAAEALELYCAWAGWDGTDATDAGTSSDDAAMLWAQKGVRWGEQWLDIPAIVNVDPANGAHLRAAIAFLGPVQLDIALPLAWQDAPAVWSIVSGGWGKPGSWGDHRVCAGKYDAQGLYVVTWGTERLLPWNSVATYAINCEATVSRSWLDTMGLSPGRLDLAALESEMKKLAA